MADHAAGVKRFALISGAGLKPSVYDYRMCAPHCDHAYDAKKEPAIHVLSLLPDVVIVGTCPVFENRRAEPIASPAVVNFVAGLAGTVFVRG